MRAFKVMPKALRILAKKLTHLTCNSRFSSRGERVESCRSRGLFDLTQRSIGYDFSRVVASFWYSPI